MEMNDRVKAFVAAYGVKVPSKSVKNHNRNFVEAAIDNIDRLLEIEAAGSDRDIWKFLATVRTAWDNIINPPPRPVTRRTPFTPPKEKEKTGPKTVGLSTVAEARGIINPFEFPADSSETVDDQLEKIRLLLSDASVVLNDRSTYMLKKWQREWKLQLKKLKIDFGGVSERKGPPASYLAKRANRSIRDAELRQKMRARK